jgi:hypothetical protein
MTTSISGFNPARSSAYAPAASRVAATPLSSQGKSAQLNTQLSAQQSTATPVKTSPTTPTAPKIVPKSPTVPTSPNVPPPGGPVNPLLRGFAIGIGLTIGYSLPDWLRSATGGSKEVLEGNGAQCDPKTVATNYLNNLKQDGVDQAVKAIPPKVFEWQTPNGYKLSVKQGWGKDGLVYNATLQGSDGKKTELGPVKAQVTSKGVKVPLKEMDFVVGGENFGKLNMSLQVGKAGLSSVEMAFTSNDGIVSTLKLKPQACGLDLTQSQKLKVNAGNPADARYWAELHLAQSAKKAGGSLKEGINDLLTVIKPSASGVYRNHGSDALGVLTKPLNALKNAGVDMAPLQRLQDKAANEQTNSTQYRTTRDDAARWMTQELSKAIAQGKIAPLDLVNDYNMNYGVASIVKTQGPVQRADPADAGARSKVSPQTDRVIKANWRELQQVAAGAGYAITQLNTGRLFAVGIKPDKQSQDVLLDRLAGVLKVKKEQLAWRSETQTVGGVQVKGIAIEPRVFAK